MAGPARDGSAGALLKALVALVVLGAAGGAGYRYYTLGYILSPPPPPPREVSFRVEPEDAELLVNGEPFAERLLTAEPKESYVFELRAPGRLPARYELAAEAREGGVVSLRLPHAMHELPRNVSLVEPVEPAADATAALVDAAHAKLALYAACVDAMAATLRDSREAYLGPLRGGRPGADSLPAPAPLATDALAACHARIPEARERSPSLDTLDAAGVEYLGALEALGPQLDTAIAYYRNRDYERDRFRWARKAHREVVDAYERAAAAEAALAAQIAAQRAAWGWAELDVLAAYGYDPIWQLRRAALTAEAWVRAATAGAHRERVAEARDAFFAALDAAEAYAAEHPERMATVAGGTGFTRALAPLRQLAGESKLSREQAGEAVTWFNQAAATFNKLVITR